MATDKRTRRYQDNEATLFLTFDIYAQSANAEKARTRAIADVTTAMDIALDQVMGVGFARARYVIDVHVRNVGRNT
jgi:hypothetical protein